MASFNRIILVGNLTRDPQLRYLPSQTPVVEFGMATNFKYRTKDGEDREDVCFVDCKLMGRGAEVINQYCQKGRQLLVEGRLQLETWDDKQTGQKRSKHVVRVENFTLLGSRQDGGGGGGSYQGGGEPMARSASGGRGGAGRPAQAPAGDDAPPISEESQVPADDIPF